LTRVRGFATTPAKPAYDVVIVGGAMLGASVAWFLTDSAGFDGSVLVVERDPSYALSSTAHSNSCIRQQFSREINVRISQFAADYINDFRAFMGNDPRVPRLSIDSFGYLYLADSPAFAVELRANQRLQAACGADTRFLSREQIARAFPFYDLDGILGGTHNPTNEGYFDGNTLFQWWQRASRERGVEYIRNEVVAMALTPAGSRIESVTLASGEAVACGTVVNASGPRAARTAAMAGITIPVEPRKRYTFVFSAETPLDRTLPLTIDPSGVHMRSDGACYMAGCPPDHDGPVDADDFTHDPDIWQDKAWPAIAARIPQFNAIRLTNCWVGHYAFNSFDQNAILGPHSRVGNFIFVNGFSGHGFQQSPAMGRGVAELIAYGEFRSLDLTPFGYARIDARTPFAERAVI